MVKEYKISFPSFDSDIYDIEMMDLEGIPLFYHSVKNLQQLSPESSILVEAKSQKVTDYCNQHGIVTIEKGSILPMDATINAYQPFLNRQSKYAIVKPYCNLEVTDLQSYCFALYIADRLRQYGISEKQKQEKASLLLSKEQNNEQICLIGDSLIEYWTVEEIGGYKVFNCGIGDLTSSECYNWIVQNLQLDMFRIFFIIISTNDLKYGVDKKKIVNNVVRIINAIHNANNEAKIIYSLVPNVYRRWDRRNDEISQLNIALCDAIRENALVLSPSFLNNGYGELDSKNTIDGLHFNDLAYSQLKKQLIKIIS